MDLEKFYLQTKHWKLFLYFILFSVISQIIAVPALLNRGNLPVGILLGLIGSVGLLAFLGWFYFIIKGLSKKIEKTGLKVFRASYLFFVIFPALYLLIVFIILPYGFTISTEGSSVGTVAQMIIIPAHLLSMFSIFFMMYKAAKTVKIAEFQRKVNFGDFAGEFFLMWFFPLGIWIVQPKINKFAE